MRKKICVRELDSLIPPSGMLLMLLLLDFSDAKGGPVREGIFEESIAFLGTPNLRSCAAFWSGEAWKQKGGMFLPLGMCHEHAAEFQLGRVYTALCP